MAAEDKSSDRAESRRQLVIRAAVVVGLIVVLVAGLLIYEERKDTPADPVPVAHASSPIGNSIITAAASTPALPEEISRAVREAPDATQATVATMSAPIATIKEEPKPQPREEVVQSEPAKRPAPVAVVSPQPVAQSAAAPKGNDRLVVDNTKQAQPTAKPAATAKNPPPAAVQQPVVVAPPVAPATPHATGFMVQLGVFNNQSNAEELRTKLALAGIPTQVETRVQLGPFKTREEALKAQQTLRSLGVTQGLLVPPRSAEHVGK